MARDVPRIACAVSAMALSLAGGGCGSGSGGHDVVCVYPAPQPRYAGAVTPGCSDTRDDAFVCWGVKPAEGERFLTVSAAFGITDVGLVECWRTHLAAAPPGRYVAIDDDGRDACAAKADGGVVCWGCAPWPRVPATPKFTAVVVGGSAAGESDDSGVSACGLTEDGDIECWGDGSSPYWSGRLHLDGPYVNVGLDHGVVGHRPDGRVDYLSGPRTETLARHDALMRTRPPSGLDAVELLRAGSDHACALQAGGEVRCWGDARPPPRLKFHYISRPDFWDSYCGITLDGKTYCWGNADPSPPATERCK